MGQPMNKITERSRKTKSGFSQKSSLYQAQNCKGCPLRGTCFKAQGNRIVERNSNLERNKSKVRGNMLSELGEIKRKQRSVDVEPVFAHIKSNRNFKRFTHIGIQKAELEFGLHVLAHNLRKKCA
ncbi:transposase [Chryseobacterium sp. A321]